VGLIQSETSTSTSREEEMTDKPAPRTEHPYHMHDNIRDQPDAVARVLKEEVFVHYSRVYYRDVDEEAIQ